MVSTSGNGKLFITIKNYKNKGPELRELLIHFINNNGIVLKQLSDDSGVKYRTLLNFYHNKNEYMFFNNMHKLERYLSKRYEKIYIYTPPYMRNNESKKCK